jgi:hypothetical protein
MCFISLSILKFQPISPLVLHVFLTSHPKYLTFKAANMVVEYFTVELRLILATHWIFFSVLSEHPEKNLRIKLNLCDYFSTKREFK